MKRIKLTDWQERALKTFVQAFFGMIVPQLIEMLQYGDFGDVSVLKTLLCSALAAGLSAVWNLIKERSALKKEITDGDYTDSSR